MQRLERTTFETSRESEYFSADELTKQTGQPSRKFGDVVVKELADNALDAAEAAGAVPHIEVGCRERAGLVEISVSDNGLGIRPEDVEKILNFTTRTSDKAAYRSPTRGAQGNALKTVIGIPHALGCTKPIVVEAQAIKHIIKPIVNPAGSVRILHEVEESDRRTGTKVTVSLPHERVDFDHFYWASAISLFNPHAFVKLACSDDSCQLAESNGSGSAQIYKPIAPDLTKYRPTDPTSPHWYDIGAMGRLIGAHIGHANDGGENLPLGKFVRQFKGVKSTAKASEVCQILGNITHLSDFEKPDHQLDMSRVRVLLDAMQRETTPPTRKALGRVGKDRFRARFGEMYDVIRFDYRHVDGFLPSGLPYTFEFAVAETADLHKEALFYGVNYSPAFDDPLGDMRFKGPEYVATGTKQFLLDGFAHPEWLTTGDSGGQTFTAVAVHIITPAPLFMERGKTRLDIGGGGKAAEAMGQTMFKVLKPYYKEGKRRIRNAKSRVREAQRSAKASDESMSLKAACFTVIPAAVEHVSSGHRLRFGARRLYYRVRELIKQYTEAELTDTYFRDNILQHYQREHGKLKGLYYDPRGRLHEPHGGRSVDMGTREVESYSFPAHVYNKLLYVEKKGQFPLLQDARLMERYDMAIMTGEGFATEAARRLLESADKHERIQIFVLHDADRSGYDIARTVREETKRMPGYSVDVIDLGLTVGRALELGVVPEKHTLSNSLSDELAEYLQDDPLALEYFTGQERMVMKDGKPKAVWDCKRIELDALTSGQVVDLIEEQLKAEGVYGKVVPDKEELPSLAEDIYRQEAEKWADEALEEALGWKAIREELANEFIHKLKLQNSDRYRREVQEGRCAFLAGGSTRCAQRYSPGEAHRRLERVCAGETR